MESIYLCLFFGIISSVASQTLTVYHTCPTTTTLYLFYSKSSGTSSFTAVDNVKKTPIPASTATPFVLPLPADGTNFAANLFVSTTKGAATLGSSNTKLFYSRKSGFDVFMVDVSTGYDYAFDVTPTIQTSSSGLCNEVDFVLPENCVDTPASPCTAPTDSTALGTYQDNVQALVNGNWINDNVYLASNYAGSATQQCEKTTAYTLVISCPPPPPQ